RRAQPSFGGGRSDERPRRARERARPVFQGHWRRLGSFGHQPREARMNDANNQVELDAFLVAKAAGRYARFRKPLLIVLAVLGTLLIGGFLLGGDGPEKSYATTLVARGDLQVEVIATGNLAPTNEVAVGSELSGLIETVFVDVNDRVVKG